MTHSSSGPKPPTMAEVARRAGVSVMTVSYVYNQPERVAESTLRRVLDTAQRLGYQGPDPAARSLRRGHAGSIGVILGEHLDYAFEDPQARRFLAGAAAACRAHHSGMTLIPIDPTVTGTQRIRATAVDGYIVWTTDKDNPALDAVAASGKPVAVHGGPGVPGAHLVTIDNATAAEQIAGVVFSNATRPAVVSFPLSSARAFGVMRPPDLDDVTFPVTRERLRGIYSFCAKAGVPRSSLNVAVAARNDRGAARSVIDALLDARDGPDAVLAMSDELAFAVLDGLASRRRRVPVDVSVSGWDDSAESDLAGLTTVSQSLFDQGQQCARIALGEPPDLEPAAWHIERRKTTV